MAIEFKIVTIGFVEANQIKKAPKIVVPQNTIKQKEKNPSPFSYISMYTQFKKKRITIIFFDTCF